jgi:rsbT co-antagonist protein RsbR
MLELSTPVVKLWDGILALPMIGTLDSSRTQVVMESLLQRIVHLGVDLSGVTTKATLADALALAMQRSGLKVVKLPSA